MSRLSAEEESGGGMKFSFLLVSVIAIVLGACLGIARMATIPPEVVRRLPEEDKRELNVNYIIRGDTSGGNSNAKERSFVAKVERIYSFTESELNGWARRNFSKPKRPEAPKSKKKGDKKEDDEGGFFDVFKLELVPTTPNFRITENDTLQILVVIEVLKGKEAKEMHYRTEGTFEKVGGTYRFKPKFAELGSAKLPPELATRLFDRLAMSFYDDNDYFKEFTEAWELVGNISIKDGRLTLSTES